MLTDRAGRVSSRRQLSHSSLRQLTLVATDLKDALIPVSRGKTPTPKGLVRAADPDPRLARKKSSKGLHDLAKGIVNSQALGEGAGASGVSWS